MNHYFLFAAILSVLVGIVHSLLGELLVFRKLRGTGVVPINPAPPLQSRNIRILWATWHATTVFGLGFSAILFGAATGQVVLDEITSRAMVFSFLSGAALVLFATQGKHPGWAGLLAVALLVYLGSAA